MALMTCPALGVVIKTAKPDKIALVSIIGTNFKVNGRFAGEQGRVDKVD